MKNKTSLVAVVSLSLMALSGGVAQAAGSGSEGVAANPACTDLRNGRLCISITPVNQQGSIRVSYEKKTGTPIYGHLEWVNPANQTFKSPDIWMYAGNTYYQTWPTWVGPGCNYGVIYNATDRESSVTPLDCV